MKGNGGPVAKVAFLGLLTNVMLGLMKGLAGWTLNSAVLVADASHSITDTLGDILTLFCLCKAQKRPSPEYPFGYGKLEAVGTVVISIMYLLSSVGIGLHSCSQLLVFLPESLLYYVQLWIAALSSMLAVHDDHGHSHSHYHHESLVDPKALVFVFIGIVVKEALFRYTRKVARTSRSSVLEASAYHHHIEGMSAIASFIAIAGSWYGLTLLDPLGGLVLALINGREALSLLVSSLQQLCDHSVSLDTLRAIEAAMDEAETSTNLQQKHPLFTWDEVKAVNSGPSIIAYVRLRFERDVLLADALATEQFVRKSVQSAYPAVRIPD
ncbi:hypothetical protein MVES1_000557 [Malassezia vespertilionis]|uniref:Cation efflux protein transmembrane domain-containing protein n=1 Tax=Malassezia vespertilionis TaxID=2020962 RepID=A0A2N1JH14_9BASI|nr:uncharacterized protein MVES1_000557 [Malassezia vespertilionis]PKI85846.1 hypothetical protein MVES_000515 [Malassezia vespertilionis]WFD05229.1 hypothetical protein MVES1_000557 [Malassezia vespertilionis]